MAKYQCPDCQYIYDECKGEPHEGFQPNTNWGEIPEEWACPDCAVRDKIDFKMLADPRCEITQLKQNDPVIKQDNNIIEDTLSEPSILSAGLEFTAEKISITDERENTPGNKVERRSQSQAVRRSSVKKIKNNER
jgi:rubredoxin